MSEQDKFPSLRVDHPEPHGWIQWKGTTVCMDVYCACGEHTHIDADFLYHLKCGRCGRVYECDGNITLHPLEFEPENTKQTDVDDEDWLDSK